MHAILITSCPSARLFTFVIIATLSAPSPASAVAVLVADVRAMPLTERVEALGTLKANESVNITANVTETISAIHFDDGQRVEEGDILVELTSVEQHALLDEARARAYGDRVFEGVVRGVDSRVDPVTRAIQVRALIPNPERTLKPGLLMQVELLVDPRDGLVVPEAAILHQGQDHFVQVIVEGDEGLSSERRQVRIGTRKPGLVEVREGLAQGDRVIVHGHLKVRPGQPVEIPGTHDDPIDPPPVKEPTT
ncbi:MAG: efflux RND transporter periplasmic adaptor subunit [Thiocapsa sp.]|nr:efflux RND transporter periplasmic adaptor subunit [Thiocapsa sp.]QVL49878.1 MAG: efflux RND transporter periplasmic adaptor subunit [Thiocapsa sp.]